MQDQMFVLMSLLWIAAILGTPAWVFLAGRYVTRLRVTLEAPHRRPGPVRETTRPPDARPDAEFTVVESGRRAPRSATQRPG